MTDRDDRVRAFAEAALGAMSPERRAELELLAQVEPGMWLRPAADDPAMAELVWAGRPVGRARWDWLNTGAAAAE